MWRTHTTDREPYWCTALIFARAYGQCFMSPVIVHQAENCTQDLHWKIPKEWVVHNTPSGYMDRYGWMKWMIHFKAVCGANTLNPHVLFYDVHDSHFDDRSIHILRSNHIKTFVLNVGYSGNDQPNDNGPKIKLKGICWQDRMNWQRHHGTLKFKNSHMNAVLVETWRAFQISSSPVTINSFKKTKLVTLTPIDEYNNT